MSIPEGKEAHELSLAMSELVKINEQFREANRQLLSVGCELGVSDALASLLQISDQLEVTLSTVTSRVDLQEQSIHDRLTGLYHRSFMEEVLEQELARAVRESYPVSLAILDLDCFKEMNRTYGSQGGDKVLKVLSDLLRTSTRREDTVCRYTGDQFVVVLPNASSEIAQQRVEQWRRDFASRQIHFMDTVLQVSISAGIAVAPLHGKRGSELIRSAEYALYQAKAEGRDRSVVWQYITPTPATSLLLHEPFPDRTPLSLTIPALDDNDTPQTRK